MRPRATEPDEQGTALILALVFLLSMGLLMGVLVTLSGSNLMATTNLQKQRDTQYSADGAMEAAIQTVRYLDAGATSTTCASPVFSGPLTINGEKLNVWCLSGSPRYERQVTFWACPQVGAASLSACQGAAISQAQILYDDVKPDCVRSGANDCSQPGLSFVVESWSVGSASH